MPPRLDCSFWVEPVSKWPNQWPSEHTPECLALKVARSTTSEDVINALAELFAMRGVPVHIRSDNIRSSSPWRTAAGSDHVGVEAHYIEPRSPRGAGFAESFHGRLRGGFLTTEIFDNLGAAHVESDRTARWAARPPPSSPPRVLLPLRRRSSSTRQPKKHYPLPNPYLHNPWYRKSRLVTPTPAVTTAGTGNQGDKPARGP